MLQIGRSVKLWTKAGVADAENVFWARQAPVWNNTGDTALLRDALGAEVARYAY